jgi:hypothetical protein
MSKNRINIESKNSLARLLATENLTVQHAKIPTASFDVKNRVLNLPIWKNMTDVMYEGLIGHEVGHALYTIYDEWKGFLDTHPKLKDYANVIEDARIEKKMKIKFPGMRSVFYGMYDELNTRDFFGTNGRDLDSYGILDRINLHFKLGMRAQIKFDEAEQDFVNRVALAETFEDVSALAIELAGIAKDEKLNTDFDELEYDEDGMPYFDEVDEDSATDMPSSSNDMEMPKAETDETGEDKQSEETEDEGENEGEEKSSGKTLADVYDEENPEDAEELDSGEDAGEPISREDPNAPPRSETQRKFDDSLEDLNDQGASSPIYVDLPKIRTKEVIVGYKKIGELLTNAFDGPMDDFDTHQWESYEDSLREWKRDSLPIVNYMVKEFEMKQSASAHRRTSISKTGVLDTNKMHAYKYDEDIFKRASVVKDGRSHALCIYVDWSASMSDKIHGTVKQTINLVHFARKVGIPVRVYAFSNSGAARSMNRKSYDDPASKFYNDHDGNNASKNHLKLGELSLREFFNEKINAREFNKMIDNFYKVGLSNEYNRLATPEGFSLHSTPLNECIIASYEQVSEFKRETGKEKVNVIFLTDGASNGNADYWNAEEQDVLSGFRSWSSPTHLMVRDPKTKQLISTSDGGRYRDMTSDLLSGLGRHCDVNVIGFFLTSTRHIIHKINGTYGWDNALKHKRDLTKTGYASFKSDGYDKYFMVKDTALDKEFEFEEPERDENNAVNKRQLRSAFRKFTKGRRMNKMLLNEFVAMVA